MMEFLKLRRYPCGLIWSHARRSPQRLAGISGVNLAKNARAIGEPAHDLTKPGGRSSHPLTTT
jgi:hypothetical protein